MLINNIKNVSIKNICSSTHAIADSGCTNHYFCTSSPYTNKVTSPVGISVIQPDGSIMQSSHTALIDAPHLPLAVRQAHIFPSMRNKVLLSLGQFCDNGYDVALSQSDIHIIHHHDCSLSLHGTRDPSNGMWIVDISAAALRPSNPSPTRTTPQVNNVYELNKKRDIVTYLHKAAFSPVPSTWIEAIDKGFFNTWPGLTAQLVKKHLLKSPATVKGHMRSIRQNLRSTKPRSSSNLPPTTSVMTTSVPADVRANNIVSFKLVEITGKICTDQTGKFLVTSSKGNK